VTRGPGIRRIGVLGATLLTLVTVPGCGGGDPTFSASEFVAQVNSQGLSMTLGRQLAAQSGAKELFAVSLPPLPGEPSLPPGGEEGRGASGSLYVFDDGGDADDQLEACRAAGGLVCFRASNVVVILDEESSSLEAQRLAVAIRRLRPN